jgi:molybdopterin/thiamine biosynthesis adenylyltransferase
VAELHGVLGLPAAQGPARLAAARVVFAGLGPAARIAARLTAASGVGTLVLADAGVVTDMDQATLPAATTDTGRPRARLAAEECLQAARVAVPGGTGPTVVMEGEGPFPEILRRARPVSLVVAEVDESGERAEAVNAACLEAGVPVLFHEETTLEAVIGPATVSASAPCYQCLVSRRLSHLRHYDEHLAFQKALRAGEVAGRQPAVLGGCAATVGGLLAVEVLGLLSGAPAPATAAAPAPDTAAALATAAAPDPDAAAPPAPAPAPATGLLVADFRTSEVRREALLAVPGCPACGSRQLEVVLG